MGSQTVEVEVPLSGEMRLNMSPKKEGNVEERYSTLHFLRQGSQSSGGRRTQRAKVGTVKFRLFFIDKIACIADVFEFTNTSPTS